MPKSRPSRLLISSVAVALLGLAGCTQTIEGPPAGDATGGRRPGSGGKGSGGKGTTGGASGTAGSGTGGSGATSGEGTGGASSGTGGSAGTGGATAEARAGYSRLTRAEYRATVEQAFGLDPDVSLVPVD